MRAADLRAIASIVNRGERRQWYSISNASQDEAEVLIYDVIGTFWDFGIPASEFVRDLRSITAKRVTMRINSPGGQADEAVAIRNAWNALRAEKTTIIDGIAASAASFIGLGSDRVLMAPQSRMMIHEASSGVYGHKRAFRHEAGILEQYDEDIADMYVAKAGRSRREWLDLMEAETWFKAEDAISLGLADGLTTDARAENRYDPVFLNIFENTPADLLARSARTNGRLDKRDAEQALRDAGMPAAAAKALVSRGWEALDAEEAKARDLINKLHSYAGG